MCIDQFIKTSLQQQDCVVFEASSCSLDKDMDKDSDPGSGFAQEKFQHFFELAPPVLVCILDLAPIVPSIWVPLLSLLARSTCFLDAADMTS